MRLATCEECLFYNNGVCKIYSASVFRWTVACWNIELKPYLINTSYRDRSGRAIIDTEVLHNFERVTLVLKSFFR